MTFWNKKDNMDYDNIASVVILEQTQLYSNTTQRSYSHEPFTWNNLRVIDVAASIPAGAEITFSVTYKEGRQIIVKAKSGTEKCNKLLQMAIDAYVAAVGHLASLKLDSSDARNGHLRR